MWEHPFHHVQYDGAVVYHIVHKEIKRPRLDTSPYLMDEWWNICFSCWNHNASQQPVMSGIVSDVKALQV